MKGDAAGNGERLYPCPVPDFGISKIELQPGEKWNHITDSLEILVIMEGEVSITGNGGVTVRRGEAAAILAGEPYVLEATKPLLAYRAFVPRLG
jgi:mannose-6-phosphate isomerase